MSAIRQDDMAYDDLRSAVEAAQRAADANHPANRLAADMTDELRATIEAAHERRTQITPQTASRLT
jgi:hypothetical protein